MGTGWPIDDDHTGSLDRPLGKPVRVEVTAGWSADQRRKQASYAAQRAAWQRMLEHRAEGTAPAPVEPCRCKKCGRSIRAGAQLRLPL